MSFLDRAEFLAPGRAEQEIAARVDDDPTLAILRQRVANFVTGRNLLALFAASDFVAARFLVEADVDVPIVQPAMAVAFLGGLYGAPIAHWLAGNAARSAHNYEESIGVNHDQLAPPIVVPDTVPEDWK